MIQKPSGQRNESHFDDSPVKTVAPRRAAWPGADPDRDVTSSVRTRALTKTYGSGETRVDALRGVDLDVGKGEMIVLLGPSGSGKSTLLNILGGLDAPSSGEVIVGDQNLQLLSDDARTEYRRQHVGFVFQFYNLIASLTAEENVSLVTEIAESPMAPAEALGMVGLHARGHHFPAQLSGGEQQRVAIARAIAKRPSLLLCDEPTGALDSQTGGLVLEALVEANSSLQTTTLVITHNASIAGIAHRVLVMGDGQIQETRTNAHQAHPRELSW